MDETLQAQQTYFVKNNICKL